MYFSGLIVSLRMQQI